MPTEAATANEGVHPQWCSAATSGAAATRAPVWPRRPVSWVTMGMRTGGNHSATIRSSGMKTMASPIPTATRASTPIPKLSAKAKANCATVIVATPANSIRREPNRSSRAPTGICIAAYTKSWTIVKTDSFVAAMSKRSAASSPATPRELRWKTARM